MAEPLEGADAAARDNFERIDMTRDVDVAYWCRLFDISHHELRRAVQQVGPRVPAVWRYLKKEPPEADARAAE